ncbi:MAG: PAS domain S-box protein [Desulfosalsimonadaceae bacterium]
MGKKYKTIKEAPEAAMHRKNPREALTESETTLRKLFMNAPVGIFRANSKGELFDANPEMARIAGFSSHDTVPSTIHEVSLRMYVDPGRTIAFLHQLKETGYVENFECEAFRWDGEHIWLSMSARISRRLSGDDFEIEGFAVEITPRKEFEGLLQEYRSAVEGSEELMAVIDKAYAYRMVNKAYLQRHGKSREDVIGKSVGDLVGMHYFQFIVKPYMDRCFAGENVVYERKAFYPTVGTRRLEVHYHPLWSGSRVEKIVAILRDITDYKKAENELRQSQHQLRQLAAYLQNVREQERTEIARTVHDELGQALTGLKIDLGLHEKQLARCLPDHAPLFETTKSMTGLVDYLIKFTRELVSELRPSILDDLGLDAAVEWYIEKYRSRTGLSVRYSSGAGLETLDGEIATALYRIVVESLTNVTRHARANAVMIDLTIAEQILVLKIKDDGVGITRDRVNRTRSFGIVGMRERALAFGGTIEFDGRPGKGTTVRVQIPLAGRSR